ncbi:CLUMA_CG006635, isoform A [Clunio marinus]|uniref:CLUMA_CG006635, isoform A n=1 Tax=Clunio marinus TaxID=568069 RepID=A0A1J1HXW6_9DIPT|nr:CLUMA_CG006635, isoform A [Clunio marinus]
MKNDHKFPLEFRTKAQEITLLLFNGFTKRNAKKEKRYVMDQYFSFRMENIKTMKIYSSAFPRDRISRVPIRMEASFASRSFHFERMWGNEP